MTPIRKASEILADTRDPGRVRPGCARQDFESDPALDALWCQMMAGEPLTDAETALLDKYWP